MLVGAVVLVLNHPLPGSSTSLARPQETVNPPPARPRLYFIIDDAGQSLPQLKPFLQFPGPLTIAVIPHLPHSREVAELSHAAGKLVLIHQPMQPVGNQNPGADAILVTDSEQQIQQKLDAAIRDVPWAIGVNNHMGSRATADFRVMNTVLEHLKSRNLFFLDSLTTAVSESARASRNLNLRIQERDVFLDNEKSRDSIMKALEEGQSIARKKGHAVMIGHVWTSELAEVLTEIYPFLLEDGFTVDDITTLLKGE